jgi:hypothetical protein
MFISVFYEFLKTFHETVNKIVLDSLKERENELDETGTEESEMERYLELVDF